MDSMSVAMKRTGQARKKLKRKEKRRKGKERTKNMADFVAKELKVRLTFIEEVLGSSPSSEKIYSEYIASKAPDPLDTEDEIEAIGDEEDNKGVTVFPKQDGKPGVWDYQIKGAFKDACGGLSRVKTTESAKIKAYKKVIDKLIFVEPRFAPYQVNGEIGICERPLRTNGATGERTALAASETLPAGSSVEFSILLFDEKLEPAVREWLDYGKYSGFGQWRNSGKGRYTWEEIE